ncbi:hypothetical protein M2146_002505 [Lachnospiraceae bacterium PF1-22]
MDEQIHIFDFLDKGPASTLEKIFGKISDPVMPCANCLCDRCVNNMENMRVEICEVLKPCFNCDECRHYDNNVMLKDRRREDCQDFTISNHEAMKIRKKIRLIK